MNVENKNNNDSALRFIILLGLVSLFSDITYQSFRSITGPYLAILGASATTVGVVAGFGEMIGYVLRFFTGFISDKTKKYWDTIFVIFLIAREDEASSANSIIA